jgi:dienelactone hydrolase
MAALNGRLGAKGTGADSALKGPARRSKDYQNDVIECKTKCFGYNNIGLEPLDQDPRIDAEANTSSHHGDGRQDMKLTNYLGLKKGKHAFYRTINQGLDYAIVDEVISGIESEDDWYPAWMRVADQYQGMARTALEKSRSLTAGENFVRAALAFHFAQYLHFSDIEQKREAGRRRQSAYGSAMSLYTWPGTRLHARFEDQNLPIVLRLPDGSGPFALALLICGSDSTKEEHYRIEQEFLQRGMATASFDGPGQGELEYLVPMISDYHRAISAVLEEVTKNPRVDSRRVGIVGFGFGGMLAVMGASHDSRISACVSVSGYYDMSVMDWSDTIRANRFRHLVHASSVEEAKRIAGTFTLGDCIRQLRAPLLVMHGASDAGIPASAAARIANEAQGDAEFVAIEKGVHCFHNVPWLAKPLMADWLVDHLPIR